jgi:hypothetical protein
MQFAYSCTIHHNHLILLEGPLELHTSIAVPHTLSHQKNLHSEELIGHSVAHTLLQEKIEY